MSPELEEFRSNVLKLAILVTSRSDKIKSEASTNTSLVQPFLTTLGYDVGNPDEVFPEHHADYSQKYQNKVDYAILHQNTPVVAIESKRVGADMKDDSGQLRSYFHALQTVKLGILTDGLKYHFYADSDKENVMDDAPFLRFDFARIAKDNSIDDNTLEGIASIRRGSFNPEDVGAEAKRKLLFESVVSVIRKFKMEPSDDFIIFILRQSEIGGKISKMTQKIIESNRELVRSAMEAFVAQEALSRFGYAPKDVVKTVAEPLEAPAAASVAAPEPELVPSDAELKLFDYAKYRLFYLVRVDALFQEVQKLLFRKTKATFRIYYGKPNVGSLLDCREQKDGRIVVQFPALEGKEMIYSVSPELDDSLLRSFTKRVTEAGVKFDTSPVLRSISGGQAAT
jgi:predicted type IV restriction endonuclease